MGDGKAWRGGFGCGGSGEIMSEPNPIYESMADQLAENGYVSEAIEMLGKGYDQEYIRKELPAVMSGFTPAPDVLITEFGFVTALVWGKVWRYCQMSDGICRAKLETLAGQLGMSVRTIIRHIDPLVRAGYLKDITPELKNRPHIYADTGKVRIRISVEATMTKSHSTMTESHSRHDRESLEESKVRKNKEDKSANADYLSATEKEEAEKKFFAILEFERMAREKMNSGIWRGRELIPPHLLTYADWWHSITNIDIKTKKPDSEWLKAFSKWYDNQVTLSTLDEAYAVEVEWKKVIAKPSELTAKAIAIQALPKPYDKAQQNAITTEGGFYVT